MKGQVSVVIPTCDRRELVRKAVESAKGQSLAPLEIIVVDNGRVLLPEGWLPSDVKVLRTPPRIGRSRARNLGAANATGQFVAFLDDDDTWALDYLSQMLAVLERTPMTIAIGSIVHVDPAGRRLSKVMFPEENARRRELYYRNPGFGGCNFVMAREEFTELGGFDEGLPASEDRDLAVRLMAGGFRLVPVPEATVYALQHSGERSTPELLRGNALFLRKHWRTMTGTERWQCARRIAGHARNRILNELKRPLRGWGRPA